MTQEARCFPGVWITHETPEWEAWREHRASRGMRMPSPVLDARNEGRGWFFPSAWPPVEADML